MENDLNVSTQIMSLFIISEILDSDCSVAAF